MNQGHDKSGVLELSLSQSNDDLGIFPFRYTERLNDTPTQKIVITSQFWYLRMDFDMVNQLSNQSHKVSVQDTVTYGPDRSLMPHLTHVPESCFEEAVTLLPYTRPARITCNLFELISCTSPNTNDHWTRFWLRRRIVPESLQVEQRCTSNHQ